ncbi:low-density lipoprotein receptor class A repeat-containing protein [Euryarchaeota archaeon]|nr:low-density lipoprotein receptor class A repeat-containing protein [Euryarchaeota archaeon]
MNMRTSAPSLLLTALLLAALVPAGPVAATPTEASEFYYGVEYDWTSVDSDLTNFTGLDIPEMLGEVMGAADDAGLNLVVGQLLTGSSNVYVHHSEDITPQTIQDMDGEDVTVWSRTDEVTLRHGVLFDGVLMTDWMEPASFGSSDDTSFDIAASTSGEQVLTVDIGYTEYLDEDYNLVGADMAFSMEVSVSNDIELDALFEGGGEQLPIDFDTGISMSYAITESATQWRLGSPSPIYVEMSSNDFTNWYCMEEWEMDMGMQAEVDDESVIDHCGTVFGTYTGALDYSFSLTGIPTEDIGLDAGELDIELSDSITESGTFEDTITGDEMEFSMGDSLTVDLGDGAGLTTSVTACTNCPPGNPLMFFMMGQVIGGASESFAESVAEDVADELSDSILSIFEGDDAEGEDYDEYENQWQCDSGDQWVYEWDLNNGYDDCYDGSDEMDMSGSWSAYGDNIYMNVKLDEEMLSFDEDGKMFMCDDGMEISWDQVNDWSNDCANSEDEDAGRSEGDMFTCDDGTEIEWDAVNDYNSDCATAEDEGATGHYTVEAILTDAAGTPLSQQETTMCDANGCDTNMEWFYGNVGFDTETLSPTAYGEHTYCVSGMATDSSDGSVVMEFSSMCNDEFVGPRMGGNIYIDGMNVGFDASVYDYEENGNATFTVSIIDPSGNELFLDTMPIDGTEQDYSFADDVDVLEVGEYCVEMHMTQTGASEPYESYTECELVEEGQEPSDRVVAIVEAMAESDLEEVLEQFGMNLEDRLSDVAPTEFPYNDGMWAPMWSSEHAAMVGVGVYAMDDDGAYIMAGPATQGYSDDAPVKMSIRYLTGVPASTAADEAEDANSIEDIVNVEDHDLGEISEALEEAGVDTSELDFPDSFTANESVNEDTPPQTAEELAEDAGLAGALPALSPISLIAVISLAGIVIGRRTEEA